MSALVRGVRPDATPVVKSVVKELEKHGLIFIRSGGSEPIVHSVRSRALEVRQMLSRKPDPNEGLWKDLMKTRI
jgi:hypothetical protein